MADEQELHLLEKIKEGDISSYEQMYSLLYPRLIGYAVRLLKNREVAEDIVQNVFVKFWVNRASLDLSKSGRSLLYVMTRNASLDYIKSRYASSEALGKAASEKVSADPGPDEILDFNLQMTKIEKGISALPPQRQLVFRMSRTLHMSVKEIAEQLHISEGTVKKHIELAKKDLKNDFS